MIHSRCAQAGVLTGASVSSASATAHAASAAGDGASDVAKLHQLFDAAVANGMPQLVCHYVDEVCGHDDFSSPDGVEAYLQDGEMVAEWATSSLRSAEQALDQAAALRTQGAADEVDRAGAVFEALRDVLVALGADPAAARRRRGGGRGDGGWSRRMEPTRVPTEAAAGARRAARRMLPRRPPGRCARTTPAPRRRRTGTGAPDGCGGYRSAGGGGGGGRGRGSTGRADGGGLFLDDLLAGVHAPPYPFKSVTEAAERCSGTLRPACAKQTSSSTTSSTPAYPPTAPRGFARHVRLHPRLFVETRCAALLDDRERAESLELACALLSGASHPGLPLRFVATLAARGKPAAALAVARARRSDVAAGFKGGDATRDGGTGGGALGGGEPAGDASTDGADGYVVDATVEAELGVAVRLECGLATEAFMCQDAVAAAPHASRRAVADKLVARLASHAAARGALESVLDLPFDGELEPALMSWLDSDAGTAAGAAEHPAGLLPHPGQDDGGGGAAALAASEGFGTRSRRSRRRCDRCRSPCRGSTWSAPRRRETRPAGVSARSRGASWCSPRRRWTLRRPPRARSCHRRSRRPRAGCSAR